MTSDEQIAALDEWSVKGGEFPKIEKISTPEEAEAVIRALRSPHVFGKQSSSSIALYDIAVLFQSVDAEDEETVSVLGAYGLPILRELLDEGLAQVVETPPTDANELVFAAYLFVVKILAMYRDPANTPSIIEAARAPLLPDHYLWQVIVAILQDDHPGAIEICDALADPLPEGFVGVVYLDLANGLLTLGQISDHPFECEAGIARLEAYLAPDADGGRAVGATVASAFLKDEATAARLLAKAERHPDPAVRRETAWAIAKRGDGEGVARLVEMARDPRQARVATAYLMELGYGSRIPPETNALDFRVLAEMSDWLSPPSEMGRAPNSVAICDSRELFWPPQNKPLPLWLVKYRYEPAEGKKEQEGVGLVGSTTFVLFGATSASMPPEDIYALHCCYELHWAGDPRQPKELTAAEGRRLLAAHNPGFA
jgi:hypothetical protein